MKAQTSVNVNHLFARGHIPLVACGILDEEVEVEYGGYETKEKEQVKRVKRKKKGDRWGDRDVVETRVLERTQKETIGQRESRKDQGVQTEKKHANPRYIRIPMTDEERARYGSGH